MKCPKCGREIKDGSLFCEYCFADIKIVPTYDAKVEQKISETMDTIRQDLDADSREKEQQEKQKRKTQEWHRRLLAGAVIVLGVISLSLLTLLVIHSIRAQNPSYYVGQAYQLASAGDYKGAARKIDEAIRKKGEDSAPLLITRAGYLQKSGDIASALDSSLKAVNAKDATDDDRISAYSTIIAIYTELGDYDRIAESLAACSSEKVREHFSEYMAYEPVFSKPTGEYDGELVIELSSKGNGAVFYSMDGSDPLKSGLLYSEPIRLSTGRYRIRAVYVNHYGAAGKTIARSYVVRSSAPEAPDITPSAGTVQPGTQITATLHKGTQGTIYYTDDGTDPSASTKKYEKPIPVPDGNSVFRFAVITQDGKMSPIVQVHYTSGVKAAFPASDAPNYILVALIKRGEVVSADGTIAGGSARFSYTYESLQEIKGYGNFYIFEESLVDNEGNAVSTGREFAVNISNGTVNLYSGGALAPIE